MHQGPALNGSSALCEKSQALNDAVFIFLPPLYLCPKSGDHPSCRGDYLCFFPSEDRPFQQTRTIFIVIVQVVMEKVFEQVYMVRHGKEPGVVKVRYYRCLKCGSTKKTVETETDFIYQQ